MFNSLSTNETIKKNGIDQPVSTQQGIVNPPMELSDFAGYPHSPMWYALSNELPSATGSYEGRDKRGRGVPTGWCTPVISWFIPSKYDSKYHTLLGL